MSYLRGSANYVWCTTSVLGKGATGAVFQGVSKHDGEPVAVKTFNQLSHMRPQEVQVREFEVLKKVKHENIVKLLAIEEEQDQRGKVIVMELCTGGSLFNILDDPENSYGLGEDEFLLVLGHLAAGMKHLRESSLVHRDLKVSWDYLSIIRKECQKPMLPTVKLMEKFRNIMKYVAEDGRVIYKLTDFGAARELEEDGEFMSLYGTEEYLHPDLYERAVLRKPMGKSYTAFVDLWSIGVTLFHVATGFLPFRPYGGRKNKEMMYYIVTKKESGVISGSQSTENGAVEWKRDLPSSCQLSAGLKIHVVPLLAGLMEVDTRKRWTFDNFFTCVTNLLRRKKVHVFFVNRIQSLRVYVDLEEQRYLSSFQCLVMEQTDIAPDKQIFLYKDRTLAAILDNGKKPCSEIPDTTEVTPVMLLNRENNNIFLEWDTKDLTKFPSFPNLVNVENDASLAKHICGVGYAYRRRIEKICVSVDLINNAVKTIVQVIFANLTSLHKDSSQVQTIISSVTQQLGLMTQSRKTCQFILDLSMNVNGATIQLEHKDKMKSFQNKIDAMNQSVENLQQDFRNMASRLLTLEQPIKQLHTRFVENQVLIGEWNEAASDVKDISRASIKASTHVSKLRDSWQHLLRDRATRSLTYNDEQFHILERIKMQEKSKCLTSLLYEDAQQVIAKLTEVLSDWYKTSSCAFIQTEIIQTDMNQFQENLQLFLLKLNDAVELFQNEVEGLTLNIKHLEHNHNVTGHSSQGSSLDTGYQPGIAENEKLRKGSHSVQSKSGRREYVRTFNRGLKELTNVQEEVWNILKENAELVNQFQTLTLSILSPDANQNFESSNAQNFERNSNFLSLNKE